MMSEYCARKHSHMFPLSTSVSGGADYTLVAVVGVFEISVCFLE